MNNKLNSILLVDDDPISNFLTERLLLKMGVAENVTVALNGIQALEIIVNRCSNGGACPELIILDINMPVMSGIDFLRLFWEKKFKESERSTIVVVSTSDHYKDKLEIQSLGVRHILQKPLTQSKIDCIWDEVEKKGFEQR